jgi:hypothetical protein
VKVTTSATRVFAPASPIPTPSAVARSGWTNELKEADGANFHAVVNQTELTEISLTDRPAHPQALATSRHRLAPEVQFYDLMIQRVRLLIKLTA